MKTTNHNCRKNSYNKVGFDLKRKIIDEIHNGRISINHASGKYQVSRTSIYFWMKKYATLDQKKQYMSKKDEIKKLKEKIEELEFVKDFQQDVIADMELLTGVDMAKKSLPKTLAKEIEKKKRNRLKGYLQMKSNIKIMLLAVILSANLFPVFGQTNSDKIIFLTDYYTTFIEKVNADDKNGDSIYKEIIQNSIYDKYFQKSEYASIVKDFFAPPIQNTFELKKSIDRITENREIIKTKIIGALKISRENIDNDSLTIYIMPVNPENRKIIDGMTGIMGLTAGSKQIILTIEPDILGWENMLEYAVAHEFNHAYWTNVNFGKLVKWTLLDYLVFEGRGDYFAHLLYPKVIAPWTMALTENQKTQLWEKIKPNLQSEDMSYQMEVMFGSGKYPIWGGYSLGYDIVLTALIDNKNLKAVNWTNLEVNKILELSKYK